MIKIPYEEIISKIKEGSKISEAEISSKIKEKMDQLAGLISKEGAAYIVANELGVKMLDSFNREVKIKNIAEGMKSASVLGKVIEVYGVKVFSRKDGSTGKIGSFVIADETGKIRVVLWNEFAEKLDGITPGAVIRIKDAYVKENQAGNELHLNSRSEIEINPKGEGISAVFEKKNKRKKINELNDKDSDVELLGTIVQVFEPRFYEICPECGKRLKSKEEKLQCEQHGIVEPSFGYVINLMLDDGSSSIRSVFFRKQMENLLAMESAEIMKLHEAPSEFQHVKDNLLGKIIKVVGKVSRNEMFQRLEFIAQLVYPEPDPDDELKRLEKDAQVVE